MSVRVSRKTAKMKWRRVSIQRLCRFEIAEGDYLLAPYSVSIQRLCRFEDEELKWTKIDEARFNTTLVSVREK